MAVKKLIAFLFLTVFIFNLVGFRLVYFVMQQNADNQFIVQIDNNNFSKKDLVEIRIPNPIPYTKASENFDRIDGEISFHNKVYKYVFKKVSPDFITILCLPDYNKTVIKQSQQKFEKNSNTVAQDNKSAKSGNTTVKVNLSDYDYSQFDFTFKNSESLIEQKLNFITHQLPSAPQKVNLLPPENTLYISLV